MNQGRSPTHQSYRTIVFSTEHAEIGIKPDVTALAVCFSSLFFFCFSCALFSLHNAICTRFLHTTRTTNTQHSANSKHICHNELPHGSSSVFFVQAANEL